MRNKGKTWTEIAEDLLLEESTIRSYIEEHCYQRAEEVIGYIANMYGVRYTLDGVTKLLKRLGFTYKRFSTVPSASESAKQEEFIEMYEQ